MKKYIFSSILALVALAFSAFRSAENVVAGPDLVIQNVELKCKTQRMLVFHVVNQGDTKSNSTLIRIRPMDGDDATQKCIQQAVRNVPILLPGKDFKLTVKLKAAPGCDCESGIKVDMFVDHKNTIAESDETNNEYNFQSAN